MGFTLGIVFGALLGAWLMLEWISMHDRRSRNRLLCQPTPQPEPETVPNPPGRRD